MAKFSLIPFDVNAAPSITIESELNTNNESVFISYRLTGDLGSIDMGPETPKHARVLKLWEKTCFELFMKGPGETYMEFNFSLCFEWNCFLFEKLRGPIVEYKKIDLLKFDILLSNDVVHAIIEIDKKKFPDSFFKEKLLVGITSVIKEEDGRFSYWALSHKDIKPNFHDPRSFVGFL
ncbi:MAG: hypothetical protein H7336_10590 [Bacteriovorax sp.]|nr:hypothetical protein [Bacteriovorax sp.]